MATIDKGIERKLLRGRIEFDGKLDLHGDTQADAQERLARFVLRKADEGARRLLVVTGKGREGQSILRQNLPRWCGVAPLDKIVLALRPAGASTWRRWRVLFDFKKAQSGEMNVV